MAKRVKFPLDMGKKDGTDENIMVRDIKELHDNYNADKIAEYFLNGKLLTWLEDRHYDEEAEQVRKLSEMPDKEKAAEMLPEVFNVEIKKKVDVEAVELRNEKLKKLRGITSDDEILNNVDYVAFSQEDLSNLLYDNTGVIYLCGDYFCITLNVKNIKYVGLNNPKVHIDCKDEIDLEANKIIIEHCELSKYTKERIVHKKIVDEDAAHDKYTDKKIDLSSCDRAVIPGELKKRFYAIFDGKRIQIAYINVPAKFVANRDGLTKLLCGSIVVASQITYICDNEAITMNYGDIVVIIGKKANSFIGGFSDKELELIAMYVVAEIYYEFHMRDDDIQCTDFNIEQRAIEWLTYNGKINNDEQRMTLMTLKKRNVNGATF